MLREYSPKNILPRTILFLKSIQDLHPAHAIDLYVASSPTREGLSDVDNEL
ncbi:MAG: hypothetical protein Q9178_001669 [Gyalolechia marmorata]